MAVSDMEVNTAITNLNSAIAGFPDAGAITSGLSQVEEAIGMLSAVWNTVGGASEVSKLKGILGNVEGTNISSQISALKGFQGSVSASKESHMDRI